MRRVQRADLFEEAVQFIVLALEQHRHRHHSLTSDGLGAHATIVCTAANAAYAQALQFLRFNGTLVCVGLPEGEPAPVSTAAPGSIVTGQLTITGSAVGNRRQALETLEYAARGTIRAHYEIEKMENLTSVFERMAKGELQGRVVLDLS